MPQSLVNILVHLVFSTRYRIPFMANERQRFRIHRYIQGTCRNLNCPALEVNGTLDHVHILCHLNKQSAVCDLVRLVKSASCKWIHGHFPNLYEFKWQKGYGAFGVDELRMGTVAQYIRKQDTHHQTTGFQDEFRALCRQACVEIDERYVWE